MGSEVQIIINILIAAALAGIVGLERGRKHKPTGMRTHMIIGSASALLISLGKVLAVSFVTDELHTVVRVDPIRIIEAIIVGVSFVGAGTILKLPNEERIANISTAASLLYSAAIGIAAGLEQYWLAAGVTLLILIINFGLTGLEVFLYKKNIDNIKNNHPDKES